MITELGKIVIINKRLDALRQEICKFEPGKVPSGIMLEYARLTKRKSKLAEILPIPKQMPMWAPKIQPHP